MSNTENVPLGAPCSHCGADDDGATVEFFQTCVSVTVETNKKTLCARCVVGRDVPVVRRSESVKWHMGKVKTYDEQAQKHLMTFLDGDTEWVALDPRPWTSYLGHFKEKMQSNQNYFAPELQLSPSLASPRPLKHLTISPMKITLPSTCTRTRKDKHNSEVDGKGSQRVLKVCRLFHNYAPII